MNDFNTTVEDYDDVLITDQVQTLLEKNNRVLFRQTRSQQFFDEWVNSNFYDLEEDVYKGVIEAIEQVRKGYPMYSYGFIDKIIKRRYQERTGTPSLEQLTEDLTRNLRGE